MSNTGAIHPLKGRCALAVGEYLGIGSSYRRCVDRVLLIRAQRIPMVEDRLVLFPGLGFLACRLGSILTLLLLGAASA